jgi:hypothetical protein
MGYQRIVEESTRALRLDPEARGLIVLIDGFASYEFVDDACTNIVFPEVPFSSVLWARACSDGSTWTTLFDYSTAHPPVAPVAVSMAMASTGATLEPAVPGLSDPAWLRPWSAGTPAPRRATHPLWVDIQVPRSRMAVLADEYTVKEVSCRDDTRSSTVVVLGVPVTGTIAIGAQPLEVGGASASTPWTVVVVSHRHPLHPPVPNPLPAVVAAHEQALEACYGPSTFRTGLHGTRPDPLPGRPYPDTIDGVVETLRPGGLLGAVAAGETGCKGRSVCVQGTC